MYIQLLQEGKNKTSCGLLEGSGYMRMYSSKENSSRHVICMYTLHINIQDYFQMISELCCLQYKKLSLTFLGYI